MNTAVILVNGSPPSKTLLKTMLQKADVFICADGGANTAARYDLSPDYIVGDFDSILPVTKKRFSSVSQKVIRNQNSTDLEKALLFAVRKKFSVIYVLGATGGRIDHELGNLSALVKFSKKAEVVFVDKFGEIRYIGRSRSLNIPDGTTLSLLPMTACDGVSTEGLFWNLHNGRLRMGGKDSISNVAIKNEITIKVKRGDLLVFLLKGKK